MGLLRVLRSLLALDSPGVIEWSLRRSELIEELQGAVDAEEIFYLRMRAATGADVQQCVDKIFAVRRRQAAIMRQLGWHKMAAELDADTDRREKLPRIPWGTPLFGGSDDVAP
jgi:hypothetical protein